MDDLPPHQQPSKPFFGTVREQGLRLRLTLAITPTIALIALVGFKAFWAGMFVGGLMAISLGISALGVGRWMGATQRVQTTPAHRAIIKLFIGLALVAALAATVTQSETIGYVAFGLALAAGIAGMWLFLGPRKRATH